MEKLKKEKVCIIDDDPSIHEIYGKKLESEGFEVVSAFDGNEGLEMVREEEPNVILLDIMMPEKDGLSVLKELEQEGKTAAIPVIILSNVSDDKTATEVGDYTTHFYVVKSLTDPDGIVGFVREALRNTPQ